MLGRVTSRFSVDFFCLTVLEIFVGETLCAVFQKTVGHEKFHGSEGVIKIFYRKFVVSQYRKTL